MGDVMMPLLIGLATTATLAWLTVWPLKVWQARKVEAARTTRAAREAAVQRVADEAARAQVARYRAARYYTPPTLYGTEAMTDRQERIAMHHMRFEQGLTCPEGCPASDHRKANR